jgi:uncharacterized protein (TIGR03435 family)
MRAIAPACIVILLSAPLFAQTAGTPAFEVATIKPSAAPVAGRGGRGGVRTDPGRLSARNVSVKALILRAYGLQQQQVSGGPGWLETDLYDIDAKAESASTPEQFNRMLQALLADRFQLTFRRDTKELPVYILTVAKNGPKFKVRPGDAAPPKPEMNRLYFPDVPSLAGALSQFTNRPVIDNTGLKGAFDIQLDMSRAARQLDPAEGGDTAGGAPDRPIGLQAMGMAFLATVPDQLGLKVDAAKAPMEVFVIERAEKPQIVN